MRWLPSDPSHLRKEALLVYILGFVRYWQLRLEQHAKLQQHARTKVQSQQNIVKLDAFWEEDRMAEEFSASADHLAPLHCTQMSVCRIAAMLSQA